MREFLKLALTRNPKKRPPAKALLQVQFNTALGLLKLTCGLTRASLSTLNFKSVIFLNVQECPCYWMCSLTECHSVWQYWKYMGGGS